MCIRDSNRRPYHCPYCGKLFKTNIELKHHVRIHTYTKLYSCRHCSDCFRWLDQLKAHLLKSHNEGTWFTCDICQQQFITRDNLKLHSLRRHEGVKPYVCSECLKRFCTSYELRSHRLVHSDFRQFCCFLCNKYFKHKGTVKKHFKQCYRNFGSVDIWFSKTWCYAVRGCKMYVCVVFWYCGETVKAVIKILL